MACEIGCPWKLPPEMTISSSANTSGLSVAELTSTSRTLPNEGQSVLDRSVDLRHAAERVGVLHLAARDVRGEDLAVLEQPDEVARRRCLARVRAHADG